MLTEKAKALPKCDDSIEVVMVDPISGRFLYFDKNSTSGMSEDGVSNIIPIADRACELDAASRRAQAVAALSTLSPEALTLFNAITEESGGGKSSSSISGSSSSTSGKSSPASTGGPNLKRLWEKRIQEIRVEQRSTEPFFPSCQFASCLWQIGPPDLFCPPLPYVSSLTNNSYPLLLLT